MSVMAVVPFVTLPGGPATQFHGWVTSDFRLSFFDCLVIVFMLIALSSALVNFDVCDVRYSRWVDMDASLARG